MLQILDLIEEHGDQLERDLSFYHQIDIYDVLAGEYSPRRILNFVRYLPSGGALKAAMRGGDEFFEWDQHAYLLAHLLETLVFHSHDYQVVNTDKKERRKLRAPEHIKIPGRKIKEKSTQEGGFAAILAAQKAHRERLEAEQNT